jgi:hypothetical protein
MSTSHQFTGTSKPRTINLGNASSSTSSATVLARARAERQARERARLTSSLALNIQRVWRGRRCAALVVDELLNEVERSPEAGQAARRGRALSVACWKGVGSDSNGRKAQALAKWAADVVKAPEGEAENTRRWCSISFNVSVPLLQPPWALWPMIRTTFGQSRSLLRDCLK